MTRSTIHGRRRNYLLGPVPEEIALPLEDEYFSTDDAFDELLKLETELIDGYVKRSLSRSDRSRFEQRVLTSHRLRRRVAFAEALAARARQRVAVKAPGGALGWLRGLLASADITSLRPVLAALAIVVASTMVWWLTRNGGEQNRPAPRVMVGVKANTLPLAFEVNRGQTDASVRFLSRTNGYSVFLTSSEAVFALAETPPDQTRPVPRTPIVQLALLGARSVSAPVGRNELPGRSHYFNGNKPASWITDIARFERVEYDGVYDGIDLVYHGNQGRLEHDFVVAPGANPRTIAMSFVGADSVELDASGNLVARVGDRQLRWEHPVLYQEQVGVRRPVSGAFELRANGSVGFEVGPYDSTQPLTIDPIVSYGTYLGGAGFEAAIRMVVDPSGAAYLTGVTTSSDFPLGGSSQPRAGGKYDAFVAKLNAAGTDLVYAAYIGGSGDENFGQEPGIAIDSTGSAYLTGWTDSLDFPTTPGALQTVPGVSFTSPQRARVVDRWPIFGHDDVVCCPGGITRDAFVTKLSPDGSRLVYSTYLGRDYEDDGKSITVNAAGEAFVVGYTASDGFPTTPGAYQRSRKGAADMFAVKLSADGSRLIYSTYIGGSGIDLGHPHAMDADGNIYIVGATYSLDFPTVQPLQAVNRGAPDGFVLKLDPAGSRLVYSTYLGGADEDRITDIGVDAAGGVFAVGYTLSRDFPLLRFPNNVLNGIEDAFVAHLDPTGALRYSRFLGGGAADEATGVAVDSGGAVFVTGATWSADFPVSGDALQHQHAGKDDAYLVVLKPDGQEIAYATFLGGEDQDGGSSVAIGPGDSVYISGFTDSPDFPVTRNGFQPAYGTTRDAFVVKLLFDFPASSPSSRVAR